MFQLPLRRILLHPLLKPEILEWDVSTRYNAPPERAKRLEEPATTPPTRSMTFIIPGFPFHLPPLEPAPVMPDFITVASVLYYLHSHLAAWKLGEAQYNAILGVQRVLARKKCCRRNDVCPKSQSDAYFKFNMRGVDLIPDGYYFGGLLHQCDTNGANIWVVVLRNSPVPTTSVHLPHLLAPGSLTWDMKDSPPATQSSQHFGIVGKPLEIYDISGRVKISMPLLRDGDLLKPFDVPVVLKALHAAMNVKVRHDTWPFWDRRVAQITKAGVTSAAIAQRNPEITYLETIPTERQRFLGLWHKITLSGGHQYILLTQPPFRPVPQLHGSLQVGATPWSVLVNPTTNSATWLNEPATHPRRLAMDVRIEFMQGSSWKLPVYCAKGAQCITVRHLLLSVYRFLVREDFNISFNKLSLHLQNRIQKRAAVRQKITSSSNVQNASKLASPVAAPRDPYAILSKEEIRLRRVKPPPRGFKRVDTLNGETLCTGLEYGIGQIGEDEWKLCFRN